MGEWIFFICKTCRKAEWLNWGELIDAVNAHSGHDIAIMPPAIWDDMDEFAKWFKKFMGWDKEEGGKDD